MAKRIYALLVGINDYAPAVGPLSGCLNDVEHFRACLTGLFKPHQLAIEVLKDSEATRDNIIGMFRNHLCRAQQEDVALFQYSGHGARWKAATAFREFYAEGIDEGLVCYDSRRLSSTFPFDLADKELAVLLAEAAANNPHLTIILDCCHSGSGTRNADGFRHLRPRQTYEVPQERPLESYIDGYYTRLKQKGMALHIPGCKHILLAACERGQLAWETRRRTGVFTDTLVEVLNRSGAQISYADLFVRCRAALRERVDNQNPQFETYQGFSPYSGFLGQFAVPASRRYYAYFEHTGWKLDCGAVHGLPTEKATSIELMLYHEDDQERRPAGRAAVIRVGAQKSDLQLDFMSDPGIRYHGEITSLPLAPRPVHMTGDQGGRDILHKTLPPSLGFELVENGEGAHHAVCAENGKLVLKQVHPEVIILRVNGYLEQSARIMLAALRHIVDWERLLLLQNWNTTLDRNQVDFFFVETGEEGQEYVYAAHEIILEYRKSRGVWHELRGKIKVRNRTLCTLHFLLVYFTDRYGINVMKNEPVQPGEQEVTLWGDGPRDYFFMREGQNEVIDEFKLFVSTERIDDFLIAQDDLRYFGEDVPTMRGGMARNLGGQDEECRKMPQNEWFTDRLRLHLVRRLDEVGANDASLAQGQIIVKGHPRVHASLSLRAAKRNGRDIGQESDFWMAFERCGMELVNFARSRGTNENILEITDIQNIDALASHPIEIQIGCPCKEEEGIWPLTFDGLHVLLGGDAVIAGGHNTRVIIDHLPELPPDNRRNPGRLLKLYFFKTRREQGCFNQLRWVEFKTDGSVERHQDMVSEKVAVSPRILLLVHGLIGDTEAIAKGLHACGVDQKFDLVLAYDYENLSIPISATALRLKEQLAAAGLSGNCGHKLTVLAHCIGGLIGRWFIEREGGNRIVDHLVMCGTPNSGSPLGQIKIARKILNVLTLMALNCYPEFVSFCNTIALLLSQTRKAAAILEQTNPVSDLIKTLNSSRDPGMDYTILAGNIDEYRDLSNPSLFAGLLEKIGKSVIAETFGMQPHDLAASVDSVLGVGSKHLPESKRRIVPCHYLDYFSSTSGQRSLMEVQW